MANLAQAERRYFALPRRHLRKADPDWYIAAQQAEAIAGALVEKIYRRIAQTRADSSASLLIKLRLLAVIYGDNPDATESGEEDEDLVSSLIRSLIADLG